MVQPDLPPGHCRGQRPCASQSLVLFMGGARHHFCCSFAFVFGFILVDRGLFRLVVTRPAKCRADFRVVCSISVLFAHAFGSGSLGREGVSARCLRTSRM